MEFVRTDIINNPRFNRYESFTSTGSASLCLRRLDVVNLLLSEANQSLENRFIVNSSKSLNYPSQLKSSLDNCSKVVENNTLLPSKRLSPTLSSVASFAESSVQAQLRAEQANTRAVFNELPFSDLSDLEERTASRSRSSSSSSYYDGKGKGVAGKKIIK